MAGRVAQRQRSEVRFRVLGAIAEAVSEVEISLPRGGRIAN